LTAGLTEYYQINGLPFVDESDALLAEESVISDTTKVAAKAFDAYMILEEDLQVGDHRLLETDNRLYLPS